MKITVTQADIDQGKQRSCTQCPIALAAARETGELWRVLVYCAIHPQKHLRVTLPEEACDFIEAFDCFEPVEPFTFEFPIEKAQPI